MKIKQFKTSLLLMLSTVIVLFSCTNLEISETDSIISDDTGGGFTGVSDPGSAVDELYNSLRGQLEAQDNLYALEEVTTDEQLVPTRGTDWGDNGIWRTLHTHTWSASHQYLLNAWNQFNQNAFRASEIIDSRSNASALQVAEAKFVRAFSLYQVLDLFGQVPFREVDEGPDVNPRVLPRTEAVNFVIQDLNDAIADLPTVGPSAETNRASKASARFLLAKVLLNKHIYTGSGSADATDMNQVISLVDDIAADGYDLQAGYFDLFTGDVDTETIFYTTSSTGNVMWNTLHYNQAPEMAGGGWNGFTTLSEFYDLFEGDPNSNEAGSGQEERRGFVPTSGIAYDGSFGEDGNTDGYVDGSNIGYGFLVGQQYDYDGTPLTDRAGNDLEFTRDLPGLVGNNERTGIRVLKYNPRNGAFASHRVIFRYADAYLMKAEAMMRSGGNPTDMVNALRTLRGASTVGSVGETELLDERARELYNEGWRRNDLIRFGQFTKDWEFKDPAAVGDETKNIFPIPSNALLSNPNLVQNPGY